MSAFMDLQSWQRRRLCGGRKRMTHMRHRGVYLDLSDVPLACSVDTNVPAEARTIRSSLAIQSM